MPWNKDSLKEIVKEKIGNHKFIVVSCSAHRPGWRWTRCGPMPAMIFIIWRTPLTAPAGCSPQLILIKTYSLSGNLLTKLKDE